jgi:hypothetical protein
MSAREQVRQHLLDVGASDAGSIATVTGLDRANVSSHAQQRSGRSGWSAETATRCSTG